MEYCCLFVVLAILTLKTEGINEIKTDSSNDNSRKVKRQALDPWELSSKEVLSCPVFPPPGECPPGLDDECWTNKDCNKSESRHLQCCLEYCEFRCLPTRGRLIRSQGCKTQIADRITVSSDYFSILQMKWNETGSHSYHTCAWLVIAPEEKLVKMIPKSFNLAQPGSHLIVRDGMNGTAAMLLNFTTGSPITQWRVSSGRYLFLNFTSNEKINGGTFEIWFREASNIKACTSTYEEFKSYPPISLSTPFYPAFYPNKQFCQWTFSKELFGNARYISVQLEKLVEIAEGDFFRISISSYHIDYYSLHIDKLSNISSFINKWITPCWGSCIMTFKSDRQITARGLKIHIKYTDIPTNCDKSSKYKTLNVISDEKPVTSPLFPKYYPPLATCKWLVTAPKKHVVGFKFNHFDLGPKDVVEIRQGKDRRAKLLRSFQSKAKLNYWWISNGQFIGIEFSSVRVYTFKGFEMKIKFTKELQDCSSSGVSLNTSGSSLKPFDELYSNNILCTWLITAPQHQSIKFWFAMFDLVQPGDYIEIRDGDNERAMIIRNYTTKAALSERWSSSHNNLWIRFQSDGEGVALGFNLNWRFYVKEKACSPSSPEKVSSDESPIQSPFYPEFYTNDQECKWLVEAPQDNLVTFTITKFDLAQGDFLEIRDGKDERAALLENFTSHAPASDNVKKSTGRFLWIRFKSDAEYVKKGFRMRLIFQIIPITAPSQSSPKIPTQNNPPRKLSQDEQKVSLKAAIGAGVGIGIVVLIVVVVVLLFIRKRKQVNRRCLTNSDPWEIDFCQVNLLEEIGQGAFGKVWKGQIDRNTLQSKQLKTSSSGKTKQSPIKDDMIVAVKMLREGASAQEQHEFLSEIEFMKKVGFHKNIISMLACCTKENQAFLIVEFIQHGDLLHLLKDKRQKTYVKVGPSATSEKPGSETDDEMQETGESTEKLLQDLISFSWQIAQGMEYLSSKGIVHRDLAARNVLIADGLVAKVADFGLSRNVTYESKLYQASASRRLPIRWMAPESLDDQIFTTKSDIWSYGVVLWEIYSMGKLPYRTINNHQILSFLRDGNRMEKPELCPGDMYELMQSCWLEDAQDRPTFSDVIKSLETMMTRDKPYVELVQMMEENIAPVDNNDMEESKV